MGAFRLLPLPCLLLASACATTGQPAERVDLEPIKVVAEPQGPDALEVYDAEALFERGLDLMRGGLWQEALGYFDRVLAEFPGSRFELPSIFNRAVCFVHLGDGARALEAADAYLAKLPADADEKYFLDGTFKRGQALALLGRHEEAATLYDELLGEKLGAHLRPADRIEALVDSGVCHFMAGDRITAEYRFLAAKRVYREASQIERLEVKYFVAQAGFYLAEIARLEFSEYKLRFPSPDELGGDATLETALGDQLEEKCQRLLRAQYAFTRTVREGHPGWASAAGYKVGQMYEELHEDLVNLPTPADLTDEQRALYQQLLQDRVVILLEKALKIWQSTADMATRTGEENEWVARTRESLERVKRFVVAQGPKRDERG